MARFGCTLRIVAEVATTLMAALRCDCALLVFVHRGESTSSLALGHALLLHSNFLTSDNCPPLSYPMKAARRCSGEMRRKSRNSLKKGNSEAHCCGRNSMVSL